MFVVTDDISLFEKAFDKKFENGKAFLEGVMSRKKDIVPKLEKTF
jgi:manganese-dependent inorganic pyrophosphatase